MTYFLRPMGATLIAVGLLVFATSAQAQSTTSSTPGSGSSGRMWGASGTGGTGILDSSTMHTQDGNAAGQVNAARLGLLLNGGPGITITSVGSQSIVNTSVVGNNNITNVTASQTTTNTGNVTNSGQVVVVTP
jgi:hypothetical protein